MRLIRNWERFWFQPRETTTIAVMRGLAGFLVLCFCLLLAPYINLWYTDTGLVHANTANIFNGPDFHFSFLLMFPFAMTAYVVFGLLMLSSITMMIGLFSRLSCIVAFLCILSLAHRDLVILNSGDTMLKMLVFYLCLAPTGASLSMDAWIRRRRERSVAQGGNGVRHSVPVGKRPGQALLDLFVYGPAGPYAPQWAQRLIQCQVSLIYISTVTCKSAGPSWHNGTAMWYVYNLAEMQRFPFPAFLHSTFYVNLATWGAVTAELAMGVLVWFPATRLIALFLGVMLHLTIEYTMNVPLFSTIMAVSYLSFLDLGHLWNRFQLTGYGRSIARGRDLRVPEGRIRETPPSRTLSGTTLRDQGRGTS